MVSVSSTLYCNGCLHQVGSFYYKFVTNIETIINRELVREELDSPAGWCSLHRFTFYVFLLFGVSVFLGTCERT